MGALTATMRLGLVLGMALLMSACGGGSDGDAEGPRGSSATLVLDKTSLNFTSAAVDAWAPAAQQVVARINGSINGTLYVVASVAGNAITSPPTFSDVTGQAYVAVRAPSTVGVGTYTSTITVRACIDSPTCTTGHLTGSPQVINVTYTVGTPAVPTAVMPHVITFGSAGSVVIRGQGFGPVGTVAFGNIPATSMTVLSASEIRASYPATLPAGVVPIVLDGGAIPYTGSVLVTQSVDFAAQSLPYPEAPYSISNMLFDRERNVLLVAANFLNRSSNRIWRYTHSLAGWSQPVTVIVPDLYDIALSPDGTRLFALAINSIIELDSNNPSSGVLATHTVTRTSLNPEEFSTLAPTNDGNIYITGRFGWNDPYLYSRTATFTPMNNGSLYGGAATMSADGSTAIAVQAGLTSPLNVLQYRASTQRQSYTPISAAHYRGQRIALDNSASKIGIHDIYNDVNGTRTFNYRIYDGNFNLLGLVPGPAAIGAINSAGTRAHILGQDGALRSYDLSAPLVAGNFPQLGSAQQLTNSAFTDGPLAYAITPDGGTFFAAGPVGILVASVPR